MLCIRLWHLPSPARPHQRPGNVDDVVSRGGRVFLIPGNPKPDLQIDATHGPKLAPIERAMGLMAGYGVQLWPILQDIHQLRATFGRRAGTFLSNAAVLQVFGVNDIETAGMIARSIGKTDARYITRSWSEGKNSSSEHISARDLINADEIMRLPEDRMILLRQGQRPAWVQKLRYYADPEFRGAFDRA